MKEEYYDGYDGDEQDDDSGAYKTECIAHRSSKPYKIDLKLTILCLRLEDKEKQ